MPDVLAIGQMYQSNKGEKVVVTQLDSESISFVAVNGSYSRTNMCIDDFRAIFPTYCGEVTGAYT